MKRLLSEDAELSCISVVNRGLTGISFELSDETVSYLLDRYNIKVQKITSGFMCYQGHNIGGGQTARSQGEAFSLFLRYQGCKLSLNDVSGDIIRFCDKLFAEV